MPSINVSSLRAGVLLAFCTVALSPGVFADSLKMKNGEKLEGKILLETPTEVTIEVKIGNIRDSQTKNRKDIQEIIKSTPDEVEVVELRKLLPSKDMMSDVEYQRVIKDKLESFLSKYRISRYKAEVEGILKTYQEEMAQAKAGAKKLEGQWISPEETVWNAYNFEARLKRKELQDQIKAGKFYDAYRKYLELEREKPASVEFVKALEATKAALPELDRQLSQQIERQPEMLKSRTGNLKTLNTDQRRVVEEAIKTELSEYKAKADEARKNKVPVIPFYEYDIKSIQDTQTQLIREQARLNKIDVQKLTVNTAQFQQGLKLLHEKNYGPALKELEVSGRNFQKDLYVKDRLEAAKKAAQEAAVASAMSGVTVPTTMQSSPTVKPADKPKTPGKTAAGAPVKPPAAPVVAAAPAPVEEDNSGIVKMLLGGAGVLLVIGIIAKIIGKKKAAEAGAE